MKRKITRCLALFALLAALPALAFAADFAVVRGGKLNLRQYADASSKSLGRYGTGTWVRVDAAANGGWWQVTVVNDGKRGYMASNYLDFGSGGTNGATVRYANGGYVNLRSGPSLDTSVVMRVTSGSTVYVQSSVGEWDYVLLYTNGVTDYVYGYMHSSFLDKGGSSAVVMTRNGGKVNVRSGPSSSYRSVGTLASGAAVTVQLKGNSWYQITGGGLSGFMSTQYISGSGSTVGGNTGSGSSGSSGTPTNQIAYVNNPRDTQVLNLRERPSQSARSIGQYRNGTQVRVVSYGQTWCEVYVGTRHGYMMTKYLSFSYIAPQYTPVPTIPVIPQTTPVPTIPVIPQTTPTPTIPVIPIPTNTPIVPQIPMVSTAPGAGARITLAVNVGEANQINIYRDSGMTQLLSSVPSGTQATLLTYGGDVCMILMSDGTGVGYVATRYVVL